MEMFFMCEKCQAASSKPAAPSHVCAKDARIAELTAQIAGMTLARGQDSADMVEIVDNLEAELDFRDEQIAELLMMVDYVTAAVRTASRSKAHPMAGAWAMNMIELSAIARNRMEQMREALAQDDDSEQLK